MPNITITIPDDRLNKAAQSYGFTLPVGGTATATVKTAFIKKGIINDIKEKIRRQAQQDARIAAQEAANASTIDLDGIV